MVIRPKRAALVVILAAWACLPTPPAPGQETVKGAATRTISLAGDGNFQVEGGSTLLGTVNAPKGTLDLRVGGRSTVKLTGEVGAVVIHLVDGKSTVDLSGLKAASVVVKGDINGSSEVSLNTPTADFGGTIDGMSVVTVAGAKRITGRVINGGSTLTHNAAAVCTFKSKDGGAKIEARTE